MIKFISTSIVLIGTALLALSVPLSAMADANASSTNLLYTGTQIDGLNMVQVYDASTPPKPPVRILKDLTGQPDGMTTDAAGNLYVTQADPQEPVLIFKPGSTSPSRTLTNDPSGLASNFEPTDVAVGSDGSVYVLTVPHAYDGVGFAWNILIYAGKSNVPTTTIATTYQCVPGGITLDSKADIFVACTGPVGTGPTYTGVLYFGGAVGRVLEFPAGASTAIDTGIVAAAELPYFRAEKVPSFADQAFYGGAGDVQFDRKGNLLVLYDFEPLTGVAIFVYSPGGIRPSKIIPLTQLDDINPAYGMAERSTMRLDATGTHIFVNNWVGPGSDEVDEYAYPSGKRMDTFAIKGPPMGIAINPALQP